MIANVHINPYTATRSSYHVQPQTQKEYRMLEAQLWNSTVTSSYISTPAHFSTETLMRYDSSSITTTHACLTVISQHVPRCIIMFVSSFGEEYSQPRWAVSVCTCLDNAEDWRHGNSINCIVCVQPWTPLRIELERKIARHSYEMKITA